MAERYPDPAVDEFGAGRGYARLRSLPATLEHARALEQVARLALVDVDLGEAVREAVGLRAGGTAGLAHGELGLHAVGVVGSLEVVGHAVDGRR